MSDSRITYPDLSEETRITYPVLDGVDASMVFKAVKAIADLGVSGDVREQMVSYLLIGVAEDIKVIVLASVRSAIK